TPATAASRRVGCPRRMSAPGRYTAASDRPDERFSNSEIATESTSRPSRERASTSRFSTTSAPGQGPDAHQPTASAGSPADAATSQKARLRLSQADTGARSTSPAERPTPRRYQEAPGGGRNGGSPAGRTHSR